MLTGIVHNNAGLRTFISQLGIRLSKPQWRHVLNIVDALITATGTKTLARLNSLLIETTDVSNVADTFRIGSWDATNILAPLQAWLIKHILMLLQRLPEEKRFLLVNLDDSLLIKDPDTSHLEGVGWHYDHNAHHRGRKKDQNALAYLLCNIVVGDQHFTVDIRPYLKEKTVRQLNRQRPKGKRLHFRSKPELAKRILRDLRAMLPTDVRVYVQFDAWFTSAKLLKYIERQGWYTIARIRSNRRIDRDSLQSRFGSLKHRRYHHVKVGAADKQRTYLVRETTGHLKGLSFPVRVWESKRHYRDTHPAYIVCTDLSVSPQAGARYYAKRWSCEIDNWYLKEKLGLGDFRLQSYEAIVKYMAVVQLAWVYLQTRSSNSTGSQHTPADVIRQHRQEHAVDCIRALCEQVLQTGDIELVMRRFLPAVAVP
jgi:hypothetical protein